MHYHPFLPPKSLKEGAKRSSVLSPHPDLVELGVGLFPVLDVPHFLVNNASSGAHPLDLSRAVLLLDAHRISVDHSALVIAK